MENKGKYTFKRQKTDSEGKMSLSSEDLVLNAFGASLISGVQSPNKHIMQGAVRDSVLTGSGNYKASGLKSSLHGNIYQLKLLMLFLKRGIDNKYAFSLATEMDSAEKFDDVVFKYYISQANEQRYKYRFLQAKHKLDDAIKITVDDLFSENDDDFSLQKYFVSYQKIKNKFKDGALEDFIICTNINFDFENKSVEIDLQKALEEIKSVDKILDVNGTKKAVRYRFKSDFDGKNGLCGLLKYAELMKLVNKLVECVLNKRKLDLNVPIFKEYHLALAADVIDVKTKKFNSQFINGSNCTSIMAKVFREEFFKLYAKKRKLEVAQDSKVQKLISEEIIDSSKSFGKPSTEVVADFSSVKIADDGEVDDFLKCLVFAVNQPNEKELGIVIAEELGAEFNLVNSEFLLGDFQTKMLNWMKEKEGVFLSNDDGEEFLKQAKCLVNQLILIGPTLQYQSIFKKHQNAFKTVIVGLQEFFGSNNLVLNYITKSPFLTGAKIYQWLKKNNKFQRDGSYIFIDLDACVKLKDVLIKAFESKTCELLVIEIDAAVITQEAKQMFCSLLEKLKHDVQHSKKIVIISRSDNLEDTLEIKKHIKILDTQISFNDLNDTIKDDLSNRKVKFQNNEVSLHQLIPKADLHEVINNELLLLLLFSEEIVIAPEPIYLSSFEESCYIDRRVYRRINVELKCLKENLTDIFAIVTSDQKLKNLLPEKEESRRFMEIEKPSNQPTRYIILDDGKAQEQFQQLIVNHPKDNIHLLEMDEKSLVWQKSKRSISGLRSYVMKNSQKENDLITLNDQIIIISAEPGMGKSTAIDHLILKKEQKENIWIIKVDLKAQKELISNISFNDISDVIKFLNAVLQLKELITPFLKYFIERKHESIVLYLDGFDEITTDNQTKIIQFIKILQSRSKILQIVIATRQHMQMQIEDALGIFAYGLRPFSETDQIKYLQKFWENRLDIKFKEEGYKKFNEFAVNIIKRFISSTKDVERNFMGIPLQTRLIADAFLEEFKKYYFNDSEIKIPTELDLIILYKKFVLEKYKIYLAIKEGDYLQHHSNHRFIIQKSMNRLHQYFAFKFLFAEHTKIFFKDEDGLFLDVIDVKEIGIILSTGNELNFIHRTFAEYFVAEFLFESLGHHPSDTLFFIEAQNFILLNLFKSRNFVILTFLKGLINHSGNNALHKNWKDTQSKIIFESNLKIDDSHFHLSEYNIENEATDNDAVVDAEEITKKLNTYAKKAKANSKYYKNGQVDIDEAISFCEEIYLKLDKVQDIKLLEFALESLSFIAKNHSFNILKERILEGADNLIKHYLLKCFAQNENNGVTVNYDTFWGFIDVGASFSSADWGRSEQNVNNKVREFKKKFEVYKNLKDLLDAELADDFEDNLSEEVILYLRLKNKNINKKTLKKLIDSYGLWDKSKDWSYTFKELFLLIDESEVEEVKEFLISRDEIEFLIKLLKKFPNFYLNEQSIERLFNKNNRTSREWLCWLERGGIDICYELKILTNKMREYFLEIFKYHDPRWNDKYLGKVFSRLTQIIGIMPASLNSKIDTIALIQMFSGFVAQAQNLRVTISVNTKQLGTILSLIETIINDPLSNPESLVSILSDLISISKFLALKLININEKLYLVEPTSDFIHCIKIFNMPQILNLIDIAKKKDLNDLKDACMKYVNFLPQYRMIRKRALESMAKLNMDNDPEINKGNKRRKSLELARRNSF